VKESSSNVIILMYHSISSGAGPTNISRDTYRRQMDTLHECDYQVVSLAEFAAWHHGQTELSPRSAVITFDDGFDDFACHAFDPLRDKAWPSTVFLPVAKMGGCDDWEVGPQHENRPLMSWRTVEELSGHGVEFGVHTSHHRDLTTLTVEQLQSEIVDAKYELEDRLGQSVQSFAPPYGRTNAQAIELIRSNYVVSVGTTLAKATRNSQIHGLPRIEMHYFRQVERWRSFLNGGAKSFFAIRRSLRRIRSLALGH